MNRFPGAFVAKSARMIVIAILNIFEKTCWSLAQSVSLSSEAIPFIPLHARFGVALLFRFEIKQNLSGFSAKDFISILRSLLHGWPRGLMDKASDFGSED